jgi:hypothetical protein
MERENHQELQDGGRDFEVYLLPKWREGINKGVWMRGIGGEGKLSQWGFIC